ncbi:hypothetical protein GCM10007891_15450 [Methylophaga thalassica]|uniref:C-type lysozyme inhibitor domain-containing protein n=1 Tax=Methylophaga thalassica TaxID=40223 RepID=A0ABQ5TU47_9GAMM|nr:hypothetical protein [Methylophaga thalassica]GLP99691.1 hypothetical protein GCM10007891_15450 [Methylophaga thalassica]
MKHLRLYGQSKLIGLLLLLCLSSSLYAENVCHKQETISFSCHIKSKAVSVCVSAQDTLIYRFGKPEQIELELHAPVQFSSTAYSGGGEGRLRFSNGRYDYIVYSGISNGEWIDAEAGVREKREFAGIYVVKDKQVLADLKCTDYADKHYIHDLPAHEQEPFVYFD